MSVIGEITLHDQPPFKLRQLAFSIIGQCLYYRVGAEVVDVLAPPEERAEHFSSTALATHIADVVIAAAKACGPVEDEMSGVPSGNLPSD